MLELSELLMCLWKRGECSFLLLSPETPKLTSKSFAALLGVSFCLVSNFHSDCSINLSAGNSWCHMGTVYFYWSNCPHLRGCRVLRTLCLFQTNWRTNRTPVCILQPWVHQCQWWWEQPGLLSCAVMQPVQQDGMGVLFVGFSGPFVEFTPLSLAALPKAAARASFRRCSVTDIFYEISFC